MNSKKRALQSFSLKPLAVAVVLASAAATPAMAQSGASTGVSSLISGDYTKFGGYVRTWGSWNMENPGNEERVAQDGGFLGLTPTETLTPTGKDEKGEMSMARASLFLDWENRKGTMTTKLSVRIDREHKTSYLKRLDDSRERNSVIDQNNVFGTYTKSEPLMKQYNDEQIRDLYIDFPINDRIQARLGKQQVVWGETDFFRALDQVTGFDYRWRSFLEVENEELRKTNWMANFRVNVPEKDGSLQILIRPGLDREEDIGNSYDITGGRWANAGYRSVDFYNKNTVGGSTIRPYLGTNYHHKDGDIDDWTGGIRWNGLAGNINYGIALFNGFGGNPVIVPSTLAPPFDPSNRLGTDGGQGEETDGSLGDVIFPKLSIIGFTLNGYSETFDAVFSTEQVYTKGVAYNYSIPGTLGAYTNDPAGSVVGGRATSNAFNILGLDGYKQKNTWSSMFRMDKTVNLQKLIGTSRPSFASVQVFNTHILNFDKDEGLLSLIGMNSKLKENNSIITFILAMNYKNDRINPTIAMGHDITYGGSFFIPSVEFVFGDNWRLKAEADIFFGAKSRPQAFDLNQGNAQDRGASLLGYFQNNDQFVLRLTRQF